MFLTSDIHSLTDFQRNTKDHIKRLNNSKRPEVLTINGKASLVIQDATAYEELTSLLDSLKHIKNAADTFDRGEGRAISDFFNEFEKKHGLNGEKI